MDLHEEDIAILEHEVELLAPSATALARSIGDRLLAFDPSLPVLFELPLRGTGELLAGAVSSLVGSLRRPAVVGPLLAELGARYARRGIRERDYRALASVLIAAVADVLDGAFTDSSLVAWTAHAEEVTEAMIDGARTSFVQALAL